MSDEPEQTEPDGTLYRRLVRVAPVGHGSQATKTEVKPEAKRRPVFRPVEELRAEVGGPFYRAASQYRAVQVSLRDASNFPKYFPRQDRSRLENREDAQGRSGHHCVTSTANPQSP